MKVGERVLAALRATTQPVWFNVHGKRVRATRWEFGTAQLEDFGLWRVVVKRRGKPPVIGIVSTRSGRRANIVTEYVIGRGRCPAVLWTAWKNVVGTVEDTE